MESVPTLEGDFVYRRQRRVLVDESLADWD